MLVLIPRLSDMKRQSISGMTFWGDLGEHFAQISPQVEKSLLKKFIRRQGTLFHKQYKTQNTFNMEKLKPAKEPQLEILIFLHQTNNQAQSEALYHTSYNFILKTAIVPNKVMPFK